MRGALAIIAALLVAAPATAARIVDHDVDDATATAWAAEQELPPPTAWPARHSRQVDLTIGQGVDHEVMRGGIYCSAYKIENPISKLIRRAVTAWDPDGVLGPPPTGLLVIHVDRAATLSRCVGNGELTAACITRVTIAGTADGGQGGAPRPFNVSVERAAKSVGVCAGMTRAIQLVSRDAVIAMLAAVAGADGGK